jgi:hypothetical protein
MPVCKVCNENTGIDGFYKKTNDRYDSVCKKCRIAKRVIIKSNTHKICKHCKIEKPFLDYQKAGGGKWLQPYCKLCDAKRKRKYVENNFDKVKKKKSEHYINNKSNILERQKQYVANNIDVIKDRQKKYRHYNIEKIRQKDREYQQKNTEKIKQYCKARYFNNKEAFKKRNKLYRENRTPEQITAKRIYDKQYREENKEKIKEQRNLAKYKTRERNRIYNRTKSATDIKFRLLKNLRSRVHVALKRGVRSESTKQLLGCSLDYFKEYFQSLFTDGMTWDKYMKGEIHIDHIIPCSKFDLTKIEEQRLCFHYSNLQPLWQLDNLIKGAKIYERSRTTKETDISNRGKVDRCGENNKRPF